MTQYTQTLTLAVPEHLLSQANHLACLVGESSADISTFKHLTHATDVQYIEQGDGAETLTYTTAYAVAHTVCKPVVTDALSTLTPPPDPDHVPPEYDRTQAEAAVAAIQSGEILVAANTDPHEQFAAWGLEAIPSEGD